MSLVYHPRELEEKSRALEVAEICLFVRQEELAQKERKLKSLYGKMAITHAACIAAGFVIGFLLSFSF